jgi:hypothetical protein
MREGSDYPSLTLESLESSRISHESPSYDFYRNMASETPVASSVHLTHPTLAERADDFVATETSAGLQRHDRYFTLATFEGDARRHGRLSGNVVQPVLAGIEAASGWSRRPEIGNVPFASGM